MNWILGIGIFLLAAGAITLLVRYFIIRQKGDLEWLLATAVIILFSGSVFGLGGFLAEVGDCPQCGYNWSSGNYCSQCGYENYRTCDYCDTLLCYEDKYCPCCGKKIID